jgi:hypothetical protein
MNDDKLADVIMFWVTLLWILFGVCMLGLGIAILKGILLYFGIENNL